MTEIGGQVAGGRYRLIGQLGRGGMGVVWRAHDEYLHRDVAIKELRLRDSADVGESEPAVRRMLREARAAAKLRHPGIITVHDVVTENGLPWIVMELIEGRSLADVLQHQGPLPVDRAAQVGIQVLRALDAAHQRGVLHRDVKPGNIMLDDDRVVLTDFGIAVIDGASALTATGQMPGSPEYIAPERIDGQAATRAADMWAVGVTLYSAVVGHSPFRRTDIQSTLAAAASREPDPDPRIGRLWPVIQGLLRKKPAERLSAKDAIDRLISIVGAPAPPSIGGKAPSEAETWIDNPSDQITIVDETAQNTRTAPPMLPVYVPPAAPGDITLEPIPMTTPKKQRGVIVVVGAVVIAAIVTLAVALTTDPPPEAQTQQSSTPSPSAPPLPSFTSYPESLGFSIRVPADWTRSESAQGEQSDVFWVGPPQRDSRVGPPLVQVRRDTTGMTAQTYLAEMDRIQSTNRENVGYQRISLTGRELEYTHGSAAGNLRFHVRTVAVMDGQGRLYAVTFQLHANSPAILQAEWQAAQPIVATIFDSFQLNS